MVNVRDGLLQWMSKYLNTNIEIRNKYKTQNSKLKTNDTDTWHFVS